MSITITPDMIIRGYEDNSMMFYNLGFEDKAYECIEKIKEYIINHNYLEMAQKELLQEQSNLRMLILRWEYKLSSLEEAMNQGDAAAKEKAMILAIDLAEYYKQLSETYETDTDFSKMKLRANYDAKQLSYKQIVLAESNDNDIVVKLKKLADDYYDLSLRYNFLELADENKSIEFYLENIRTLLIAANKVESHQEKASLYLNVSKHYYHVAMKYREKSESNQLKANEMLGNAKAYQTMAEGITAVIQQTSEEKEVKKMEKILANHKAKNVILLKTQFFQRKSDSKIFTDLQNSFRHWFNPARFVTSLIEINKQANYLAQNEDANKMFDIYKNSIGQWLASLSNKELLRLYKNMRSKEVANLVNTFYVISLCPDRLGLTFDTDNIEAQVMGLATNTHNILTSAFDAMTVALHRRGLSYEPFGFIQTDNVPKDFQPSRKNFLATQHIIKEISICNLQFIKKDDDYYRSYEQMQRSFNWWFNPHRFIRSMLTMTEQINKDKANLSREEKLSNYQDVLKKIFCNTSTDELLKLVRHFSGKDVVELITGFASVASYKHETKFMRLTDIDKLNAKNIFNIAKTTLECLSNVLEKRSIDTAAYTFRSPETFKQPEDISFGRKNRDCMKSILKYMRKKQEQNKKSNNDEGMMNEENESASFSILSGKSYH